jgi:hypothetical protein
MTKVDDSELYPKFQGFEAPFKRVFNHILDERLEQLLKFQKAEIPTNLYASADVVRLMFCTEELGEIARNIRDRKYEFDNSARFINTQNMFLVKTYNELIQLATHVITWATALENQIKDEST